MHSTYPRLLVAGVLAICAAAFVAGTSPAKNAPNKLDKIQHIVVVYEENHSFDNLYGGWEGVDGVAAADPAHTVQLNQAGLRFNCLLQNDVNLSSPAPLAPTCIDNTTGIPFSSAFTNGPFLIDSVIAASDTTCPKPNGAFAPHGFLKGTGLPGGCTADIVHRYYQEQYQIDGGKQDRYVTGSDAAGLVMGRYDTQSLPIYRYLHQADAPHYAIADRFFQGAFGGSFLNHQMLIAGQAPVFANAVNDGGPTDLHSVVDQNGMPNNSYPLYHSPLGGAVRDSALTASCNPPASRAATSLSTRFSRGTGRTRRAPPPRGACRR